MYLGKGLKVSSEGDIQMIIFALLKSGTRVLKNAGANKQIKKGNSRVSH
jgi:hypothetical protein